MSEVKLIFFITGLLFLTGCSVSNNNELDIQGHRGCRGLMPENSIPAFLKAIEIGVTTLEMDVVISKDSQVVVSHEPWLSHEICLTEQGSEISKGEERQYNLYKMDYSEINRCDCGTKPHPRFPGQKKMRVAKPLLSEVIDSAELYVKTNSMHQVLYNIEIKSTPDGDGLFHPATAEFAGLVMAVINEKRIADRTIIQSFDLRALQVVNEKYPNVKLALLVENLELPEKIINDLGFFPDIYSPDYTLVNEVLISYAHKNGMKLIPWTVNEKEDMLFMIRMGVDGFITDYPDRAILLVNSH